MILTMSSERPNPNITDKASFAFADEVKRLAQEHIGSELDEHAFEPTIEKEYLFEPLAVQQLGSEHSDHPTEHENVLKRQAELIESVALIVVALGSSDLSRATGSALAARGAELVEAYEKQQHSKSDDAELDILRAQRDLYFLVTALTVALGQRGWQEGVEAGTHVFFESGKKKGRGTYESRYRVNSDTYEDEGDFEDYEYDSDDLTRNRDLLSEDGFGYAGTLVVEIDPEHRINFSYRPDQASAEAHYEQTVKVTRDGKERAWMTRDLSVRLDLDPTAPNGLSLDVGRSPYEGENLERPGDLVGKVLATTSSEGSHTYEPFTSDMVPEFSNMAEMLIVHQDLIRRRVEETGNPKMPTLSDRESNADFERYLEQRPEAS